MNILYLIPARSGSKGLPGKNLRMMCGKPLITWSIETALACKEKGRVIVSTDDQEIADVALKAGAEVPFLRPAELAADKSPTMDMIRHLLNWMKENGGTPDYVVLLEPTSPLRDPQDISNAFQQLKNENKAESIVGVAKTESSHPAFLVTLENDFIQPFGKKEVKVLRRQDIGDVYFFEGSLYISETESLLRNGSFYHEKTLGYVMPKWKSYEIDELSDFIAIESLMQAKLNGILK
jgi:CMP-N,N'-diacetyllegionaminic acid synthase